jgi:zinc transport system substrate-binding protein
MFKHPALHSFAFAAYLVLSAPIGLRAEPINVAVTVAPVHSLVAAVMEGLGKPQLLVRSGSSEHTYSMRPSDAKTMTQARVVVRVSENLETFLNKAISTLSAKATVVTLAEIPGLTLLPPRESGAFEADAHEHGSHATPGKGEKKHARHDHDEEAEVDPHIWLDPANALLIVDHVAAVLGQVRPDEAAAYQANAEKLKGKLNALDAELKGQLAGLQDARFIVFHDAYQYFEARYGLKAAGSITVSPERQPGAARLKAIRAKIADASSACVFSEPQFEPKVVARLIEGTKAKSGVLDGLGADLPEGPDQYFAMMRNLAASLKGCLDRAG